MEFSESNTSLLQVCKEGNIDLARELLSSSSCDLLACDEDGNTALHLAAEEGHLAVVQELAGKYTTPSAGKNTKGRTPLHLASMRGHSAVVETSDCVNNNGDTALNLAALNGHAKVVGFLISEFGCSSSVKGFNGRTPLHHACDGGHFDVVEKLVSEYGCDVNTEDNDGLTPLHVAALAGREKAVRELITKYKCPVDCEGPKGCTPLHMAAVNGHVGVVRMLISEFGADVTVCTKNGNTALNIAAFCGHAEVVSILISEFGFTPSMKGRDGRTPLHHACEGSHLDVVEKLVSEYGCDVNARDNGGLTPLHVAAWYGREEVVRELITNYKCPVDCVDSDGDTPLTLATRDGHVGVVRMLLSEFGADVLVRIRNGDTALNLAALNGHAEVVDVLTSEFGCSPSVKGRYGRTPLHHACGGGHLNVVEKLVSKYGCNVNAMNAKDSEGLTPLHVAAWYGREEVVRELTTKYKCPVDCVDSDGDTPLTLATRDGHVGVVRMLLSEFGADVLVRIRNGDTALNLAALNGHAEVVDVLTSEFGCSPSVKGRYGRTPLHRACGGGHLNVVEKLVSKYGCNVNARDSEGLTPLHVAAWYGREEVVRELTTKYKCPVDCVDSDGDTPLTLATRDGHVGVVRMLLSEFGADVLVRIRNGDTALNLAALNGHAEVVDVLTSEFRCSPSVKGQYGRTPLHHACDGGHLDVVEKLVSKYGCDVNARDSEGLTPFHVAALAGREEMVRELITKYKCPVDCVNSNGYTPLHTAVREGHIGVVKMLLSEFGADVALHDVSHGGHLNVVETLVSEYDNHCDVNARDNDGCTPLYYAICNHHSSIVAELVRHNSDLTHVDAKHKKLIESARKHSKHVRTKAFIVGAPEVGKSTLVQALQSETFFTRNVKDKVPPHTAGIVPVFHESSNYGWVVFYDFAGDEEYYSSHAAILERIIGNSANIFLLVFDLSKYVVAAEMMQVKYASNSIYYWLTFLTYACNNQQKRSRLQVFLVGSHADVLQREGRDADKILSEVFTDISQSFYAEFPEALVEMFGYVALNCCLTKSQGLQRIKAQLKQVQLSSLSNVPQLTAGASILLGTLERDFQGKGKVACQVKDIIEHIKSHKLYIPPEAEQLHSYLEELHAYGSILFLECSSPREDEWIVLNLPMFLSTVHRRLFCNSYHEDKDAVLSASLHRYDECISNLGIIPTARLQAVFPEYSLALFKGCLTLLQYCQEICDPQIISKVLEIPMVETRSVLFFPALLQTSREEVKWIRSHSSLCCIGWYAECFRKLDFFPPRFLHVLLLRLAFKFALPNTPSAFDDDGAAKVDAYNRKCTLWKNGIHWLMESGVEVVVEVVKQKRAVLVMVRGSSDQQVECGDILSKVVAKVVEAKSEFCNVLKANLYIVRTPDDLKQSTIPEVCQLQLFEVQHIHEVLLNGSEGAVGRESKGYLPSSELICLQTQTIWGEYELCVLNLFPGASQFFLNFSLLCNVTA